MCDYQYSRTANKSNDRESDDDDDDDDDDYNDVERVLFVKGPNTVCRSNIERLQDGRRKVTYVPVEVGAYTITVTWNGCPIPGIVSIV